MPSAILVLDRDRAWRGRVCEQVRPYLLHVFEASARHEAVSVLAKFSLSLVVLDSDLLALGEFEALCRRRRRPQLIVTCSCQDFDVAVSALRLQAVDVLQRPVDVTAIISRITKALESCLASPHYLGRRLDRFIKDNCARPDLDLSTVSRAFGISTSYASVLLRHGHWGGFRERLTFHRVAQARNLLMATDDPLYLISETCGFSSPSRLSETFAKVVGIPPRKFRITATG